MISPTLKRLRYRAGLRAYVCGAPASFEAEIASAPEVERLERLDEPLDLVQAFLTRRSQLRELPRLRDAVADGGVLWICYPRATALGTDLNRQIVQSIAARAGLQTAAIVPLDGVWSALRCKRTSSGR